jgi:hypothetical protein
VFPSSSSSSSSSPCNTTYVPVQMGMCVCFPECLGSVVVLAHHKLTRGDVMNRDLQKSRRRLLLLRTPYRYTVRYLDVDMPRPLSGQLDLACSFHLARVLPQSISLSLLSLLSHPSSALSYDSQPNCVTTCAVQLLVLVPIIDRTRIGPRLLWYGIYVFGNTEGLHLVGATVRI